MAAESLSTTEIVSPLKPVQEIAHGEDVPREYIHEKKVVQAREGSVLAMEIPIIDLSLVSSLSHEGEDELRRLHFALSSWGCFQAVNHGISSYFLGELHKITKQFFALPLEEKQKYSREVGGLDGYGSDAILSEDQILDWSDRLYLLVVPEDRQMIKYWPQNPPTFRAIINEYSMKLKMILGVLFKAMARSLDLEENLFLNQYGEPGEMRVRLNFYPRCPSPGLVLGLKPHADGSAVTIVLPDKEVEGLQFLKDEQWFKVTIIPNALLINVGDQVEIMSNGIFKSPVHRVVANSERERMSIAVFCSPDPEKEIGPAEELVNVERPRYKSIKNYTGNYFEHYQQGKRPIDAVRI